MYEISFQSETELRRIIIDKRHVVCITGRFQFISPQNGLWFRFSKRVVFGVGMVSATIGMCILGLNVKIAVLEDTLENLKIIWVFDDADPAISAFCP